MATTKFTVRPATVEDAGAIAEAHVAAWQAAYIDIVPSSYLKALDVTERTERWAAILRGEVEVAGVGRPTDLVIERNEKVFGFTDVGDYRDAPSEKAGELWSMYVHPNEWGNGAGRVLMDATFELFAEADREKAYLWVLTENAPARGFYEHTGWSVDDADDSVKRFEIDGTTVEEIRYRIEL